MYIYGNFPFELSKYTDLTKTSILQTNQFSLCINFCYFCGVQKSAKNSTCKMDFTIESIILDIIK